MTPTGQMQSLFSRAQFFDSTKGANASSWRYFGAGRRPTKPGQKPPVARSCGKRPLRDAWPLSTLSVAAPLSAVACVLRS